MTSFRNKAYAAGIIFLTVFFIRSYTAWAVVALPLPDIVSDLTLTSSLTYTVDGRMTVWAGATLTIPAGTHIVLTPGSQIIVNGSVIANGTSKNHIVLSEGDIPPFIPFAQVVPTEVPALDDTSVETPEVQSPEIQPITIDSSTTESPEVQSPSVEPIITNTMMMGIDSVQNDKHFGFAFREGSSGTLSYTDIEDAGQGITVDHGSAVTISHGTFKNCSTGILGAGDGSLKLTSSAFDTVQVPVDWNFHGTFTHSNTSFINTELKGWRYGGDMMPGEKMNLNSTDGEYEIPSMTAQGGNSINVSAGVTIKMIDGQPLLLDGGAASMKGTVDKPITVYGDGSCTSHTPIINITNKGSVTAEHVNFRDLCSGIQGSQASIKATAVTFDTVSGPALQAVSYSTIIADQFTIHNVYQAVKMVGVSTLKISDAVISTINSAEPAFDLDTQIAFSISNSSIDGAKTCINVSTNSSLHADKLKLSHCSDVGIMSTNDSATVTPTGITITNSDIGTSGTGLRLVKALVQKVTNTIFHDNAIGVSLRDMGKTTIAHNGWGSATGPTIADNPGGAGDSIVAKNVTQVIYRPWLDMAPTGPTEPPAATQTPQQNPIIIVPGITGSVLNKDYDDKGELWPNVPKLALSLTDDHLNDLELLQSGKQSSTRPIAVGDIIRTVGSVDVFSSLIVALAKNGYTEGQNLFVLPYDWRLSNTVNQALLKNAIDNALSKNPTKTKVNIIAHSMGGLLVADYIAQNPNVPIDHLFNIAVPHTGAPKAFKTLMYGDDMGFHFSVGPLQIPVLNADRAKTISQNMPSVYELLPSKKYIATSGAYVSNIFEDHPDLNDDGTRNFMVADGRNDKMFPFAQKLHDDTDTVNVSKISAYDFVGCGATKTIGGYTITRKQSMSVAGLTLVPEYRLSYVQGDGVVPMNSANAGNGALNYYTPNGSHGTMPSVQEIQQAIVDVLNGKNITTTGVLFDDAKKCNNAGDIVEVHSPVTLDIYDDQGRHTGPTDSGDVEYGIPNVDYEIIGDDKTAFLPTGPTYKVVNRALSTGTYDMYVSRSDDHDTVINQQYFNEIPIKTASAVGTMMIGPDYGISVDAGYNVDFDNDGDDVVDSTSYPSSSYWNQYANDKIPPVTIATVQKNTVTLTAHDNIVRVLKTKYSIDGIVWLTYIKPFQAAPGTTVQFLSVDEVGNVEAMQHIVVPTNETKTVEQTPAVTPPSPTTPSSAVSGTLSGGSSTMVAAYSAAPTISGLIAEATQYASSDKTIADKVDTLKAVIKSVAPQATFIDTASAAGSHLLSVAGATDQQQSLLSRMLPEDLLADALGAVKSANKPLIVFTLGVLLITAVTVLIKNGK